ncbi:P1 family peptidase [Paracidovorax citrulli]|uniref:L-aminopeptidase DmpA n=2 Tax=Paracidovorax citrulli TaxID=80869 RepID=A1TMR0_PARC0|nr:P1 family peptidase [Paracidovorax citrulli]ABM32248.1 L-aminopeptidase DmpA [Paracidovorax citrulli AAC00-1]ATG94736.1 aminopeptidase [Paracidovorax citrulli]PVY66444.1 L-aminopeptidase DmpA [Paracidovorax citrulli]QCX12121.1 Beta-peptidyl aminopeptidase BapA [Paracidovorax citrulli]REG69386.1 L-aminopeptidase DmpA [Paracidovorax citrulli]
MSARDPAATAPPRIGLLDAGPLDAITDVAGVTVGHATLDDGPVQTGVTVIHPHAQDPYRHKVPAGAAVINGFGKSVGLVQLEELGQLETPIALTNTFSVGALAQAQIRDCVRANPETGRALPTVNPLVLECNDGYLNDIQRMSLGEDHYRAACGAARAQVPQGAVGAGRGMSSFQLKGGIGTASRRVPLAGGHCTVGALVLANYGLLPNLVWGGAPIGASLAARLAAEARTAAAGPEKGSIIMVLATDAPLDARQLRRLAWRAAAGLARTGSVYGHGSGDIALAFSTAYTLPHLPQEPMPAVAMVHEGLLDGLFQAAADSVEQAIVHALWHAEPVTGRDGHHRGTLRDLLSRSG